MTAFNVEALLHRRTSSLSPAKFIACDAPCAADRFAHVETSEGSIAAKLVGVMHAIGQFVIDEKRAQIWAVNLTPAQFALRRGEENDHRRQQEATRRRHFPAELCSVADACC